MAPRMSLPPGPKLPAPLQTLRYLREPYEFFQECADKYGDPFTLRLAGFPPIVVFWGPDKIKDVFTASPDDLVTGEANSISKTFLGEFSMLALDGPQHRRHRTLLLPPFHGERMQEYGQLMLSLMHDSIDQMPVGREFALQSHLQEVALQVILRAVFGLDDDEDVRKHAKEVILKVLEAGVAPGLFMRFMQKDWGAWSPWAKFKKAKAAADELIISIVRKRRNQALTGRKDILSLLLAARDEEGQPMGDEELRDELFTLLVAGHETNASATAWTVRRLILNPDLWKQLRDEASGAMEDGQLVATKVAALPLLTATIHESLRIDPVVLMVVRQTKKPMRLGGVDLPAETRVICSTYLAHNRPERYPEPRRFDPTRFLGVKPSPFEWLPFGGGNRRCIGMAFALYEMKMTVAAILTRTQLRIPAGKVIKIARRGVILAPSEGMPVIMDKQALPQERRPAAA